MTKMEMNVAKHCMEIFKVLMSKCLGISFEIAVQMAYVNVSC